jgi:hypothetical protein
VCGAARRSGGGGGGGGSSSAELAAMEERRRGASVMMFDHAHWGEGCTCVAYLELEVGSVLEVGDHAEAVGVRDSECRV